MFKQFRPLAAIAIACLGFGHCQAMDYFSSAAQNLTVPQQTPSTSSAHIPIVVLPGSMLDSPLSDFSHRSLLSGEFAPTSDTNGRCSTCGLPYHASSQPNASAPPFPDTPSPTQVAPQYLTTCNFDPNYDVQFGPEPSFSDPYLTDPCSSDPCAVTIDCGCVQEPVCQCIATDPYANLSSTQATGYGGSGGGYGGGGFGGGGFGPALGLLPLAFLGGSDGFRQLEWNRRRRILLPRRIRIKRRWHPRWWRYSRWWR